MSLNINVDHVGAVLLHDGWHFVQAMPTDAARGSFDLDAYEFYEPHPEASERDHVLHAGGRAGICPTGATWIDKANGYRFTCPLTSVLAVQESPDFFAPDREPKPKSAFVPKEVVREVKEIKEVVRGRKPA